MTGRTATPTSELARGVVASEVAMAAAGADGGAEAPAWIKIAPRGAIGTRDGRRYAFDPEALVARFGADAVDVPIDINHVIASKAPEGDAAPAVGWIRRMEARPDGLYGEADWLEAGRATLAARTHRYVSPTFPHDADGRALWIHSVSLVAAPALSRMPARAGADPANQEPTMTGIATALGLAEGADETACLSALGKLKAETVAKAVHDQTLATLSSTTKELDELKSTNRKAKVDAVLDAALKAKKILPAQKDAYAALCATDDGLAQIEKLIEASPAQLVASGLDDRQPASGEDSPAQLAAKAHVYRKKLADAGQSIDFADAVIAVKEGRA